eukprot:351290-Chlamydomonas_euryale.AAC.7
MNAEEARRPKRRCAQRSSAARSAGGSGGAGASSLGAGGKLPSATHYVGYVEDDEVSRSSFVCSLTA